MIYYEIIKEKMSTQKNNKNDIVESAFKPS